jgi:hypothetical protein
MGTGLRVEVRNCNGISTRVVRKPSKATEVWRNNPGDSLVNCRLGKGSLSRICCGDVVLVRLGVFGNSRMGLGIYRWRWIEVVAIDVIYNIPHFGGVLEYICTKRFWGMTQGRSLAW